MNKIYWSYYYAKLEPQRNYNVKTSLIFMFLVLCISVNSQSFQFNNLGFRVDGGYNMIASNDERLPLVAPEVTYEIDNWKLVGGLVLSRVSKLGTGFYEIKNTYLSPTGILLGVKYYIKSNKKGGMYYFMDNSILYYHSYDYLEDMSSMSSKPGLTLIGSADSENKTFIYQPILGSGVEVRFLNSMVFSVDFGGGITSRRIKYKKTWLNYPEKRTSLTGQLKLSFGCNF